MKNFALAIGLSFLALPAFAVNLVICEGKIADQDVTFIDDGEIVGIHKGKVNIAAGQRGNNFPFARFEGDELSFSETSGGLCSLSAESQQGSFTLETSCTGVGAGTIKNLNIESIALVAAELPVTCRREEYRRN